jgi:hypothetical protein
MADDEKVRDELRKRNTQQFKGRIGGKGHDPNRGVVDVVNQADAVTEGHLYLLSKSPSGDNIVWEVDLIGDLSPDKGHGRLPPVIHMFCPFCSTPLDPRAISIDFFNKPYEIEKLAKPEFFPGITKLDGSEEPFALRFHLHVREVLQCPYVEEVEGQICGAKFTIRGSRIERVG